MEVRARVNNADERRYDFEIDLNSNPARSPSPSKDGQKFKDSAGSSDDRGSAKSCGKVVRREIGEMKKVTCQMIKGEGSYLSYLFIPAFISILWLLLCFITTRGPSVTIEQRLSSSFYRDFFNEKAFEEGHIVKQEIVEAIHIPEGESVHVVVAIPFLDVNPIAASEYIKTLEWILIYSTVPVTFHIITNKDSISYVNTIIEMVNKTSNCEVKAEIVTLAEIIDKMSQEVCPSLNIREEFCEIIMGNMTPLVFPFLFPKLNHAIYVSRELVFQDNIGHLYNILQKMIRGKEAIGMAPEQTKAYMLAFSGWQRLNPKTKLGRPPPNGKPGYNPDLMLLDLEKLRSSTKYKSYFDERKLNALMKNYVFHASGEIPSLGDLVNLIAADSESLILNLGCEWNRLAQETSDTLEKQFNVCKGAHRIHVWNGNPNLEKMHHEKERAESRHLVPIADEEMQEL